MLSRFFIDRPIFATVLSVVITLIGGIALMFLPIAQYPRITPPAVVVAISYPGASAQVVADTVAAPIEQEVNGVEGMLYMSSQSGNDGSYSLTVTFDIGTDLKTALVKVQNRVTLAMPQLPTEVQNQGITIRKKTPDMLLIVNLYSPDQRYNDIYLSNFATLYIRDELLRVDGVSDISYQGQRDYSIRAWLDPEKLASRNMTPIDVANAIRSQNLDAPAGQVGQPPVGPGQALQLPLDTLGRLSAPDEFGDIIVKVTPNRPPQRLVPAKAPSNGGMMTGITPPSTGSSTGRSSASSTQSPTTASSGTATGSTTSTTTTTTSTTTSTTATTGVSTSGGGSTGGGGTTTGGASVSGGGTTGGGSTGALAALLAPTQMPGLSITTGTTGSGVIGATTVGRGPNPPSTSIVRLRHVVRANKFCARVRLDRARLAARNLRPEDVLAGLKEANLAPTDDPALGTTDAQAGRWLVYFRGDQEPNLAQMADTIIPLTLPSPPRWGRGQGEGAGPAKESLRLGDIVESKRGIERVEALDELGIERGAQNYNQSCLFDGQPSVGLSVYQLPGTNALEVADRVRAKMEELKTRFPEGVAYEIGYDTTPFIRESVLDVVWTLLEAVALVGLVVLIFLQDWRAMILPLIDVPVSIIGTFAVMAAVGFSLNNISLVGLVLAIGIVVDDAIVVLENIERLMATGLDARTATIKAMDEVTGPIIAVALVLSAVFLPCAFISGITGQFFRQFAVTIAVSTVISAINAITMTPSRAVLLFKAEPGRPAHEHKREALPWWFFAAVGGLLTAWLGPKYLAGRLGLPVPPRAAHGTSSVSWTALGLWFLPGCMFGGVLGWFIIRPVNAALGWFFRGFNHYFDRMAAVYGKSVGMVLRLSAVVLLIYGGLLVLTYWTFHKAPTGFIPQQDMGRLIVSVQLPDSASLQRTMEITKEVEKIARGDPDDPEHYPGVPGVAHTVTFVGMSFLLQANSPNFASMFMVLKPFDERQGRKLRDTAIMTELRKRWGEKIKDAVVTVYGSSPIPGLGTAGGFKVIVEDRGGLGLTTLQRQVDDVSQKLKDQPGLNNVATQFRSRTPQLFLDIDRTKVASLGVPLSDVNQTLDMYLGSLYVNSYNEFGRHWQVTVQADGAYRSRIENISQFKVRNNSGQMVPLGSLVTPRLIGGPISITRYNLSTAASINGNIATGTSTGDAINAIDRLTGATLPLSMKTEWTELMFLQLRAGNTAMYVFALSVICVFLALSALYESWALPLAVILVVPLCLLCSVSSVLFTGRDVNIFVQIGLVVLIGLACKNAILIVEYAKQLHDEGRSVREATVEASRLRLRPILMTSFAFIFGVIPLMIASGAGAEMRRSLGTAVFSGMLGVTLFGIFLTPVFFYVIQGIEETRLLASLRAQRFVACLLGAALGAAAGFLLGKLGVFRVFWATLVGGTAGMILLFTAFELHRRFRQTEPALRETSNEGTGS
jgi:multidrug efflux pump